jgi:hypothetical protein
MVRNQERYVTFASTDVNLFSLCARHAIRSRANAAQIEAMLSQAFAACS